MNRLLPEMRASVYGYWNHAHRYQKFLYLVGALLLTSAVFHTGVLLVTRGSLQGPTSWRKPILFGESFGLTAWSIAWFMTFLRRRPVLGWLLSGALGLANLGEVFLVAMQQWRGVPSHFNNATSFDEGVFVMMGLLIQLTGIVIVIVTLLTFFSLRAPVSIAWAIRSAMFLLVAGQFFGIPMIARGSHTYGAAGNMKIPHALRKSCRCSLGFCCLPRRVRTREPELSLWPHWATWDSLQSPPFRHSTDLRRSI